MAERKYTGRHRTDTRDRRRRGGFREARVKPYLALRKQYPLGEMNAHCSKGMNGGRCSACLIRTLQAWQVDVKGYFGEVQRERREARKIWLEGVWGMSDPQYESLYLQQEGKCALCGERETRQVNGVLLALAIDHSHTTGMVRELLCQRCNIALGQVETQGLQWVRRAVQYLKRHMSVSEAEKFRQ